MTNPRPHVHETPVVRANIDIPGIHQLAVYHAYGGYTALHAARAMDRQILIEQVRASGLTGRGGAGFPTAIKWHTALAAVGTACVVANGDESEPGAFKDRELMEALPHRVLEGGLIAAHAVAADRLTLFIRGEYQDAFDRLRTALAEIVAAGLVADGFVHLHQSAGAYICGEETALIEALEGNRPVPRGKPPYPAVSGFMGRPTMINNVETLACLPAIINQGAEWYSSLGEGEVPGTRVVSLSGNIRYPGNYEVAFGVNLRDLIEDLGGGVPGGRAIKAVIPGGTSTPLLTADELDIPLTPQRLKEAGSMLGTASVIVYDDSNCMIDIVANMSLFYRDESCGKCTPCREGTHLFHEILSRIEGGLGERADLDRLWAICRYIPGESVCALGDGAVAPVASSLQKFRGEYLQHIEQGKCPLPRQHEVDGVCFPVT